MDKYVAFLRGINVGGHHKVPMAELVKLLSTLGFENISTILNSGNVIFEAKANDTNNLEKLVSEKLENTFGFPVPTIIRTAKTIEQLHTENPFEGVEVTKEIRLYISLLKENKKIDLDLPWTSTDHSYTITEQRDKCILSILDLSISGTTEAMGMLEKFYGKDITTRNWKTIERIVKKL